MVLFPGMEIVILAAGDGKRMQSDTPKVLHLLNGRPLVDYVVRAAEASRVTEKPIVVVCANHRLVQDALRDRARYAVQQRQLGTGHAVAATEALLRTKAKDIIVLYGDMPFVKPDSIRRLAERHRERGNTVTLMTFS